MEYRVEVTFEPLYELLMSLHTYICRKSHKKIDLDPKWVKETRQCLTPEFSSFLDQMEINADWKLTFLLVHLFQDGRTPDDFLAWMEGKTTGDLFELIADYSQQFPEDMGEFRSRVLKIFSEWNDQYFRHIDPAVNEALMSEQQSRMEQKECCLQPDFIDQTTNGLAFLPKDGLGRLILSPQYHFQPLNVVLHFGKLTLCHYSARIYFGDETAFPPQEYRMIRSLGEQSRLKILRFLSQGPRSFTEIVRHLNLSKGITHDHVAKLRCGGLIRVHFEGEAAVKYSLRTEMLEELHRKLMDYFVKA